MWCRLGGYLLELRRERDISKVFLVQFIRNCSDMYALAEENDKRNKGSLDE
jgi:hypothetical protein